MSLNLGSHSARFRSRSNAAAFFMCSTIALA
eukprot:CAMPEP_0170588344 /NCGR_PEP_ID=MMETSP0224-20130122/10778_1 /TAXON_ID=285029 /ORGANISM="Togula jolla, Strain CCCM 725" /LENGTH=30 /DNA_ID= /DNA_START= /DNA_END= /DNA_ORIENTATION=